MIEPPVMLWVISRRPGFKFNILAGWVCILISIIGFCGNVLHAEGQFEEPSYLGIFAAFEERGHADQADIVVPHDGILVVVTWDLEDVLEHCMTTVSIESRIG